MSNSKYEYMLHKYYERRITSEVLSNKEQIY